MRGLIRPGTLYSSVDAHKLSFMNELREIIRREMQREQADVSPVFKGFVISLPPSVVLWIAIYAGMRYLMGGPG